ncbi:MAG: type II toxin-antitoxin system VapC family toxin [Myxococcaceae bacterium]
MKAVFDSNLLIDYLKGDSRAEAEIEKYSDPLISIVTWIELLVGSRNPEEDRKIRQFLQRFRVIGLSKEVAEEAILLRRVHRIRLPDAIIWGTAKVERCLLVTRNTKDFPENDVSIRIPFRFV